MSDRTQRVCPVEYAGGLDNKIRYIFHNPRKILNPHLEEGMTVLDLGCGPGFFTIPIAEMVGPSGHVIAVDLQAGMLGRLEAKIRGTELEPRIRLHQCQAGKIGVTDKVDFLLAFYMVHEVPSQRELFREIHSILKPGGKVFVIEPKFHVSRKQFAELENTLYSAGFDILERPKVFFSLALLLQDRV